MIKTSLSWLEHHDGKNIIDLGGGRKGIASTGWVDRQFVNLWEKVNWENPAGFLRISHNFPGGAVTFIPFEILWKSGENH